MKKDLHSLFREGKMKKTVGILLLLMFCMVPLLAEPCGDVNSDGIINIVDALMTAQFYVGLNPPNFDQGAADVDGNDSVNIIDALQIAQYYVGLIDELPGCKPGPTGEPSTIEMQAETDATWDDAQIAANHTGFTGSGFVDTINASGTWIEWSITVADATPAVCDFRYACASDNRSMDLSVNGNPIGNLTFPASGSWDTWSTEEAPTVNLIAGTNTIRLTATTSGGAPNMDKMDITINSERVTPVPPTPTAVPTPTPEPTPVPSGWTPPATPTIPPEGLVAFPGAEGYGKIATGGRGGEVYEVTNLSSSGSGSLKDAFSKSGRTIVFRVGGTIKGGYSVPSNTTVAGQTAPGDGIEINGSLGIGNNTIVRYIRVRANGGGDAISRCDGNTILLDHISASWSGDEIVSIYHCSNVTIQWSMITEAGSSDHRFGGIWGNNYSTYHHNLFAHNTDRNPRIASAAGYNDVRNNVIYNWKNESVYGGEVHQPGGDGFGFCSTNVVANYFKPGPGTPTDPMLHTRIVSPWTRDGAADYGDWYVADNYLVGHPDVTADNWLGVYPRWFGKIYDDRAAIPGLKLNSPSEYMPIRQQTPEAAYLAVLDHAGCSKPNRDSVDSRIIEEVRNGTSTYGDNGFVSGPGSVGGHPSLKNGTAPADSDHDGMSDAWENSHGLNPNNASDRNNKDATGYTMLEHYINSLDSFPNIF